MLQLRGKTQNFRVSFDGRKIFRVYENPNIPDPLKNKAAFLGEGQRNSADANDPGIYLGMGSIDGTNLVGDFFELPAFIDYLAANDIISISDQGDIWVLFRAQSKYNTFLLTERCNHLCLMCSQPPKKKDDSWLIDQTLETIDLIPKNTVRMGFSGGEPTLYGSGLIHLVERCKSALPYTKIDILSNGRAFADPSYCRELQEVDHKNCMICIPLYSHVPEIHNYVVQADKAFDETVEGILNLKAVGQPVEIRIVLHKQTIGTLEETCHFIAQNLLFVDHVALMGLEITGFTRANMDDLWIDPYEYKDALSSAVQILNGSRINTSVYNHQLCTINEDTFGNYAHSISDWKNEYLEVCDGCSRKSSCGGFFSSAIQYKHSDHIHPFTDA